MKQASIKKAIFPVAGYGTRFLPATKAYPKEMLPIIDKPLIQYAAEEAVAAGCTELIFVTNHAKKAIEDHFDRNIALDQHLLQKHEYALMDLVNKIIPPHVTCVYIRQSQPKGLGHAIACARNLIHDEPFAVILADDFIRSNTSCLSQLAIKYQQTGCSIIAIEKVSDEQISSYGIVSLKNHSPGGGYIKTIIEKPEISMAPSNLAVVGRYILTPSIFDALELTAHATITGEIQLTDALQRQLASEEIFALEFAGVRYDCGKKTEYLRAILEYAAGQSEYLPVLQSVIKQLFPERVPEAYGQL